MPNININIVVQPMLLPILKKNLWWAGNARAQNKPHFRMSKIRFQYRGYNIWSVNFASTTVCINNIKKSLSTSYALFTQNRLHILHIPHFWPIRMHGWASNWFCENIGAWSLIGEFQRAAIWLAMRLLASIKLKAGFIFGIFNAKHYLLLVSSNKYTYW